MNEARCAGCAGPPRAARGGAHGHARSRCAGVHCPRAPALCALQPASASGERSPGASELVGRAERGGPRACAAQVFLTPALTAAGKVSPQWATKVFVSLEILDDLS